MTHHRSGLLTAAALFTSMLLAGTAVYADVPPPGAWGCRTAQEGDRCEMDTDGQPNGLWGTCVMTQECSRWVACTDPAGASLPECRDGGTPIRPGYGRVATDCLLCKSPLEPVAAQCGCRLPGGTASTAVGAWVLAGLLAGAVYGGRRRRSRG